MLQIGGALRAPPERSGGRYFNRSSALAASDFTSGPSAGRRPSDWLAVVYAVIAAARSPASSAAWPRRNATVPAETPLPAGSVVLSRISLAPAPSPARRR